MINTIADWREYLQKQTDSVVLDRMLSRVSDDYDKREGAIIYDSLAPASLEAAIIYSDLDDANDENDIDTASREAVIDKCTQRAILMKEASPAILKVQFEPEGVEVPLGTRFNSDLTTYVVTGPTEVTCEEAGVIGNEYIGEILPIDNVVGLESATIVSVEIYGEDDEETDSLRQKYKDSFDAKAFAGNKQQYREFTLALGGVGGVKVIAAAERDPDGNIIHRGHCMLVIISSAYTPATPELIKKVQDYFDPNQDGYGNGMSPVGDACAVRSAEGVPINVSGTFTFEPGKSYDTMAPQIEKAISDYILSVAKKWQKATAHVVRIAQIEAAILNIDGIIDVTGMTINGQKENIVLTEYKIPEMGEVTNNG